MSNDINPELLLGYFQILHTAAQNRLDVNDRDDLLDALVLVTCETDHYSDEVLEQTADQFHTIAKQYEQYYQQYNAKKH